MTLKKLLQLLHFIEAHYAGCGDIRMHGSHLWANGGGELVLLFNTQPPRSLDAALRKKGFIVYEGEYIYRPRLRRRTK